jgi:hyperosmotically inducible periplasmic protein
MGRQYQKEKRCDVMRTKWGLLVLGLCLTVQYSIAQDSGQTPAQNKDHQDAFIPGGSSQSKLAQEVRHELVMLPYYGIFDDLAFKVDGSTVTLEGSVVRPVLKSDAENVTKKVEGVDKVVNNIKVLPLSPMDDRIRRAEYRAIYGDPSISTRYGFRALPSIHIIVSNGHVTLEGVVANQGDKNLIGIRANGVSGVFSVTNNLYVEKQ